MVYWHCLTTSTLFVLNNFIKKQFTTKSRDERSDFSKRQASKLYRVAQKFGTIILYALTLPNINRFSKLFHYQNQKEICNNTILSLKIPPHLMCVAILHCEMSSVLKATIENKTTSVTTCFKKLKLETTCLLSQLLSKVTVTSCSFYIKCSMYLPCCWTMRSSRRRH